MSKRKKRRNVTPERKGLYILGMLMSAAGVMMCFGVFISAFGGGFDSNPLRPGPPSGLVLFPIGMVVLLVGGVITKIAARGIAGSGMILDPERAREDLEPFSRMGGGMVTDALDEAGIDLGKRDPSEPEIKVRCQACKTLNPEPARFCMNCGKEI